MIKTIGYCDFCDSFRGGYQENFSYEGKRALFDYLEELEESTGEKIELDPIGLCCEFTEYEDLEELKKDYNDIETMEDLENNTQVIKIDGSDSFIIMKY